jgi:hypothetical protein
MPTLAKLFVRQNFVSRSKLVQSSNLEILSRGAGIIGQATDAPENLFGYIKELKPVHLETCAFTSS